MDISVEVKLKLPTPTGPAYRSTKLQMPVEVVSDVHHAQRPTGWGEDGGSFSEDLRSVRYCLPSEFRQASIYRVLLSEAEAEAFQYCRVC